MGKSAVRLEMRLSALESIVCRNLAVFYQQMPREVLMLFANKRLKGLDTSDLLAPMPRLPIYLARNSKRPLIDFTK